MPALAPAPAARRMVFTVPTVLLDLDTVTSHELGSSVGTEAVPILKALALASPVAQS